MYTTYAKFMGSPAPESRRSVSTVPKAKPLKLCGPRYGLYPLFVFARLSSGTDRVYRAQLPADGNVQAGCAIKTYGAQRL